MTVDINFTDQDWQRLDRDWRAWWAHELERPLVVIETTSSSFQKFAANFPLEMPAGEVVDYYQGQLETRRFDGDAWPRWWPNFGPGIMAGFIGGTVHAEPKTVWFGPGDSDRLEDMNFVYNPDNVWWQRIQDLTRSAVERWSDQVTVGITDIGGNFDILASLRGTQKMLIDLYDNPDRVGELVETITGLWLRYYDDLHALVQPTGRGTCTWAPVWSPGRCYMFQSDFAYMISPEMFERYVLPDLATLATAMDHSFYHLDGKGQIRHLDMLLDADWLDGIQWIPGDGQPPPEEWLPLLKRIRDGGKLCQLFVTAEGARTIVKELGGKGFALHIANEDGAVLSEEEIINLLRELTTR